MQNFLGVPKLGFGCLRLPKLNKNDEKSIDIEQLKQMVDLFLEKGGMYFDTGYDYHEGMSEKALNEALVKRYPRENYLIATKCPPWAVPDNEESAKACLDISLKRLGLDYVDYYLLHNLGGSRTAAFDKFGLWDWAQEMKAAGKIRHVGFSIHDSADALENILSKHPEVEFVQLQINYLDWESPVVQSRKCLEVARAHNKPVIAMESCRGGALANLPDKVEAPLKKIRPNLSIASWAYRFCYNLDGVAIVLSGMSNIEQANQNISEWKKFSESFSIEEQAALDQANNVLAQMPIVPCTNCRYCIKGCPKKINIPQAFDLLNLEIKTNNNQLPSDLYFWQVAPSKASDCINCGACEFVCPQGIDIIKKLKTVAIHFETDYGTKK